MFVTIIHIKKQKQSIIAKILFYVIIETKYFEVQSGDISTCLHKKYTKLPLKVSYIIFEMWGMTYLIILTAIF